ncbi:MAG TPA: DUF1566 domain-containing protein [Burkholderiaceae bacterium]|nr:DUF1566 domain-containing protein [Burkholderiaceae bacterium]
MKTPILNFIALVFATLLTACSGGGDATAPAETTTPTETTGGTGGTDGTTTTLVTTTCTPAPTIASRYARVFKGCDSAGVAQYYDLTECVRDNTTGLIWQGQMPPGSGLRASDQIKTNFDSTTGNQDYNGGSPQPATSAQIADLSNSIGYRNAVNGTNLCGSNAWRLPTKEELQGLIKSTESPKIDNTWFPNTQNGRYWTTSTYASDANYTYYVDFGSGVTSFDVRGNNVLGTVVGRSKVRLVH